MGLFVEEVIVDFHVETLFGPLLVPDSLASKNSFINVDYLLTSCYRLVKLLLQFCLQGWQLGFEVRLDDFFVANDFLLDPMTFVQPSEQSRIHFWEWVHLVYQGASLLQGESNLFFDGVVCNDMVSHLSRHELDTKALPVLPQLYLPRSVLSRRLLSFLNSVYDHLPNSMLRDFHE